MQFYYSLITLQSCISACHQGSRATGATFRNWYQCQTSTFL